MPGFLQRLSRLAVVTMIVASPVLGDGGTVQLRKRSGPFTITLFSSESPMRTGTQDLSVLVEISATSQPVLDSKVTIELQTDTTTVNATATHAEATNKVLYAARPMLPFSSLWQVTLTVVRGAEHVQVSGNISVVPGPPVWFSFWPYFALVPVGVGLYALNQRLKKKQRG